MGIPAEILPQCFHRIEFLGYRHAVEGKGCVHGSWPVDKTLAQVARRASPWFALGLMFDGKHFWTNHREQNQIVCFKHPVGA